MARTDRPYVRVYYVDLERDYPAIYANDTATATWLRLLVLSEKAWPIDPELPRSVKSRGLRLLTAAGLVKLLDGHRYQIKGYRKERGAREARAKGAADTRWHPPADPSGGANANANAHAPAFATAHPSAMPSTRTSTSTKGFSTSNPKRAQPPREPLLTKAQLDEWASFGAEWDDFKAAWLGRGFMFPPAGSPDDDDGSQRGLLWSILDSRPSSLPRWIREAPGKSTTEVIAHVLRRWHDIRDAAEPTEPQLAVRGPNRHETPERIGSVLPRVVRSRHDAA